MKTVQIRLTEDKLKMIDDGVEKGVYASRSDAIRSKLTELESIKETLEIMSDPEFIESIRKGLKDLEEGRVHKVEDLNELFEA